MEFANLEMSATNGVHACSKSHIREATNESNTQGSIILLVLYFELRTVEFGVRFPLKLDFTI